MKTYTMKICKNDFTMEICKNNHILWKYVQKILLWKCVQITRAELSECRMRMYIYVYSVRCSVSSLLQVSFAKKTCNFKEPTNRYNAMRMYVSLASPAVFSCAL